MVHPAQNANTNSSPAKNTNAAATIIDTVDKFNKNKTVKISDMTKPIRAAKIFGALSIFFSDSFSNRVVQYAKQLSGLNFIVVKARMKKSALTNVMINNEFRAYAATTATITYRAVIRGTCSLIRSSEIGQNKFFI